MSPFFVPLTPDLYCPDSGTVYAANQRRRIRKKFRIGTSLAELAVVRASRMKIIHVVTVINTSFPVTDKVIYTFIYYLMENRPYI